jgi:UDPglucose 6-dehydrogenase
VSTPEFLREGHAVYDFLHTTRILIGTDDPAAAKKVAALYDAIRAETIITDPATAELAKYAANCFLATKLSYVNTLAELCETFGADITNVMYVLGADPPHRHRLSPARTRMGRPLCLQGCPSASPSDAVRRYQLLRDSPATRITHALAEHCALVTAHDPTVDRDIVGLTITPDAHNVAIDANALVLLTDWPEYRALDWTRISSAMTGDLVLDTRNALDAPRLADAGLRYVGIGRGRRPAT